jgi:membrane protease YdiL (CAAX protease family)
MTNIFVNRAEGRLRSGWRILLLPVAVGALAFAPLIAGVEFLASLYRAKAFLPDLHPNVFDKVMDFIAGPSVTVALIVIVALLGRYIDRRRWSDFGLVLNRAWRADFVFGLILGAALIALVFAAESALGWVDLSVRTTPGQANVPVAVLWIFIFLKGLCVGTGEELVSRGYFLKNLSEGLNGTLTPARAAIAAALLSSVAFAALHLATDNFDEAALIGLTINGILLAVPMLLTGRLGISIGLHIAWNITQGGVFGYPVSGDLENISVFTALVIGPVEWTGGTYGPEAGYLGWFAMVAGILAVIARERLRTGSARILPEIAEYRPR